MIRRGEIYFADLGPVIGREQDGRRPVLVVSSDEINALPLVITVIPGTHGSRLPTDYSTNVRVSAAESGLPQETVFLCYQIRSLDPRRIISIRHGRPSPVGRLSASKLGAIEDAVRLSLNL